MKKKIIIISFVLLTLIMAFVIHNNTELRKVLKGYRFYGIRQCTVTHSSNNFFGGALFYCEICGKVSGVGADYKLCEKCSKITHRCPQDGKLQKN